MNPIQYQVAQLWQNLSEPDTGNIYQQAIAKTGELIQQFARLLFLCVLVVVALVISIWSLGFQSGRGLRMWMESENVAPLELTAVIAQGIWTPIGSIANWAQLQIKQLLGIDVTVFLPSDTNTPAALPAADTSKNA